MLRSGNMPPWPALTSLGRRLTLSTRAPGLRGRRSIHLLGPSRRPAAPSAVCVFVRTFARNICNEIRVPHQRPHLIADIVTFA